MARALTLQDRFENAWHWAGAHRLMHRLNQLPVGIRGRLMGLRSDHGRRKPISKHVMVRCHKRH